MDGWLPAERALLGAVLTGAGGRQDVLGFVEADDFCRPWHGRVLAAMQRLRARGVLAGPQQVYAELQADPDLPRSVAQDAVPLADLLAAAPRASHAPAYAGMVIADGVRRRLGVSGGRVRQAAEAGRDPVDDLALESVRLVAARAGAEAESDRRRWASLPADVRRELPVPSRDTGVDAEIARRAGMVRDEFTRLRENLWAEDDARLAGRLALLAEQMAGIAAACAVQGRQRAGRAASREARPSGTAAEAAGLAALRDLVAGPARIGDVAGWLQPEHFARADHGQVYAVMAGLHQARMPVDPVTVCWEASRRGIRMQPEEMAGGCGAFAAGSAAQVYRRSALARAERAGVDIQAAAADPAWPVSVVTEATGKLLGRVEADLKPGRCSVPRGADVIALPVGGVGERPGDAHREAAAREAAR